MSKAKEGAPTRQNDGWAHRGRRLAVVFRCALQLVEAEVRRRAEEDWMMADEWHHAVQERLSQLAMQVQAEKNINATVGLSAAVAVQKLHDERARLAEGRKVLERELERRAEWSTPSALDGWVPKLETPLVQSALQHSVCRCSGVRSSALDMSHDLGPLLRTMLQGERQNRRKRRMGPRLALNCAGAVASSRRGDASGCALCKAEVRAPGLTTPLVQSALQHSPLGTRSSALDM